MVSQERRGEIALQLTKSAVDLQKWSGKEISIVYTLIPTLIGDAFIAADVLFGDPHGIVLAGGTIFTLAVAAEYGHVFGRIAEKRTTVPISSWFLPNVISPGINALANRLRPAVTK